VALCAVDSGARVEHHRCWRWLAVHSPSVRANRSSFPEANVPTGEVHFGGSLLTREGVGRVPARASGNSLPAARGGCRNARRFAAPRASPAVPGRRPPRSPPNRPTPRTPSTIRLRIVLIPARLRTSGPVRNLRSQPQPPRRNTWTHLATPSNARFPAPDEGFGGVRAVNVA